MDSPKALTLDNLLAQWSVFDPGTWDNEDAPGTFYAVANTDGIIAYFADASDAYRFRLAEINRRLNG